jgi:hypothetical protein
MKRDHHDSHYGQLCLITGGVLLWMDEIQEMDEMNVQICVCVCVCVCGLYPNFGNFLYADREHLHIGNLKSP